MTTQVQPTIDLLNYMHIWHPEVLIEHSINPEDYQQGLVFRSAIESIRGTFIASSTSGREGIVADVLQNLYRREIIQEYRQRGYRSRYDFEIVISRDPDYFVALEVKGGEGNSINISDRPIWAKEFCIWSHLDGGIRNQPARGALSVINRIANELVRRKKQVDVLFIKDVLCGTRIRPCPKYPGREAAIGLNAAPDVFLFPREIPTPVNPEPPVHTLQTLRLPNLILDLFRVSEKRDHIWEVKVSIVELPDGRLRREVRVTHKGVAVTKSASRPWSE